MAAPNMLAEMLQQQQQYSQAPGVGQTLGSAVGNAITQGLGAYQQAQQVAQQRQMQQAQLAAYQQEAKQRDFQMQQAQRQADIQKYQEGQTMLAQLLRGGQNEQAANYYNTTLSPQAQSLYGSALPKVVGGTTAQGAPDFSNPQTINMLGAAAGITPETLKYGEEKYNPLTGEVTTQNAKNFMRTVKGADGSEWAYTPDGGWQKVTGPGMTTYQEKMSGIAGDRAKTYADRVANGPAARKPTAFEIESQIGKRPNQRDYGILSPTQITNEARKRLRQGDPYGLLAEGSPEFQQRLKEELQGVQGEQADANERFKKDSADWGSRYRDLTGTPQASTTDTGQKPQGTGAFSALRQGVAELHGILNPGKAQAPAPKR